MPDRVFVARQRARAENVIERCVVRTRERVIVPSDLPPRDVLGARSFRCLRAPQPSTGADSTFNQLVVDGESF